MPRSPATRTKYSIRFRAPSRRTTTAVDDYLVAHPRTGALVPRRALATPWRHRPALLPRGEAQAKADELRETTGEDWSIELAPNDCPSCERKIDANRPDFCYTPGVRRDRWRAGCNEHDGGCGFEVEGDSYEDVLTRWNRASANRARSPGIRGPAMVAGAA